MPAFIITILNMLGLAVTALGPIESMIAGFGTFLASEAAKFFPSSSLASDITTAVNFAEGIIADFDTAATDFEMELKNIAPDLTALLGLFPWLPKQLMAIQLVQKANPGATPSFVINTVQTAHANVRVASPAVQKQIADLVAANKKP